MPTPTDGYTSTTTQEQKEPGSTVDTLWEVQPRAPSKLTRIAVKSVNRIVIVQVADIVRIEAEDNYVRLWADRPYLHKETLTGLVSRLPPHTFLRIHRSHAINVHFVRELRPQLHGEYEIILANGTELTSGRAFRAQIQIMFGLI